MQPGNYLQEVFILLNVNPERERERGRERKKRGEKRMKQGGGSIRRWVFVLLYYNAGLAFHWKAKRWQAIQRDFCTAHGITTEGKREK